MRLLQLSIQNFRNIREASLEFPPGAQLLVGKNAQGKTSLLEALYFLATATSPRTRANRELVLRGSETAYIHLDFERQGRPRSVGAGLAEKERRFRVDGEPLRRISDLYGNLRAVFFSPEDLEFLAGGPAARRRTLDLSLCQRQPAMVRALLDYRKTLKQRNALLKTADAPTMVRAWDRELARLGARVIEGRAIHALDILDRTAFHYLELTRTNETLAGLYRSSGTKQTWSEASEIPTQADLERLFLVQLGQTLERDLALKTTSCGPHRDDLVLEIAGVSAERYASQGQRRSAVLSLKLAERDLLAEGGEPPILLVDDVTHEMDAGRCQQFLQKITSEGQALLTFTEEDKARALLPGATRWLVTEGRFSRTL
jgi:DNA replication and repair protein RecF